jgi:chromosomal replication initiation ATPase DnaA
LKTVKKSNVKLNDLKSRLDSFIDLGIDLPTDDLLRVIITKSFSDKQIKVNVKILEYIVKNIDRSYEKIFKLIKEIDEVSLSTGKSININLIKKVLKNE